MKVAAFQRALCRETLLLKTQVQHWALPLCFAMALLVLLQFALDEPSLLTTIFPRMYSIIVLLVMFLLPEYIFKNDWTSGYLPQYALSPIGLSGTMLVRLFVQGVWMGVPLFSVLLLSTYVAGVSSNVFLALMISVMLLIPILFLLSAFSGALTLMLSQTSLLGIVILMPFYCPPLIVAQSMVMNAQAGMPFVSEIYLMIAMLIGAVAFLPWVTLILLRSALR